MKIFQQCNARNWRFNRSRLHDRLSPNEREGAKQQQKLLPSSSFPACRTRSRLDERDKGKSFIGCSFDATFCKNVIGIKWRIIRFLSVKEEHRERWLVGFSSLSLSSFSPSHVRVHDWIYNFWDGKLRTEGIAESITAGRRFIAASQFGVLLANRRLQIDALWAQCR